MARPTAGSLVLAGLAAVLCAPSACTLLAQEQYPPALKHTPTDHPADHVLIIDVAGLHARDLDLWVRTHPGTTLAALSARGDTFTNAWLPSDDPVVGLLALATAGTPLSTNLPAESFFARDLSPAEGDCRGSGTVVELAMSSAAIGLTIARDPARGCAPVQPHQMLLLNTIFDLVRARGGQTVWAGDDDRRVDLLRGWENTGLSDAVAYPSGADAHAADERRVVSMKRWIDGKVSDTNTVTTTPTLMGLSLSEFAEAQQSHVAYRDGMGTLTPTAEGALLHVDQQMGNLVEALQRKGVYERTWILVTSTQLFGPADNRPRIHTTSARIKHALARVGIPAASLAVSSDCLVWLRDERQAEAAAAVLWRERAKLGIDSVSAGHDLAAPVYGASTRAPSLQLHLENGWLWDAPSSLASHSGSAEDTRHVAMLVSGAQLGHRSDPTLVPTTQAAALLLRALGLEKLDLEAQQHEHAPALPGVF